MTNFCLFSACQQAKSCWRAPTGGRVTSWWAPAIWLYALYTSASPSTRRMLWHNILKRPSRNNARPSRVAESAILVRKDTSEARRRNTHSPSTAGSSFTGSCDAFQSGSEEITGSAGTRAHSFAERVSVRVGRAQSNLWAKDAKTRTCLEPVIRLAIRSTDYTLMGLATNCLLPLHIRCLNSSLAWW